jgi:UDP-N-acetyl-D-mannosaminuronate dehydrogenase
MDHPMKRKIASRTLRVAVIGLGYVGLPLATAFAAEGFHVTGIDIDRQKVEQAARGESYVSDISSKMLHELIEAKRLHFTSLFETLDDVDATKPFGFMPFLPGPGLGGHCIPIDPHYLSWKLRTLDYTARFIELAAEINTSMPHYVVDTISKALNEQGRPFNGATVLVLGVAYKRNINDIRESPALDIIAELQARKAVVIYNDEYVPTLTLRGQDLHSQPLSSGLLQEADCVVIVTDHDYYDVAWIVTEARCIVDTRNKTRGYEDTKIFRL